jgi:PAS domain S-box-containing protein
MSTWGRTLSFWLLPKPTGDPGRDRNALTLQLACLLFALAVGLVAALDLIEREPTELPLLGMAMVGLVAAAVMNRVERWKWAGWTAFLSVLLTAIMLVVEARDGFRSHAMLLFPGLLLTSVMLLDRISYMATAGTVLLTVAALGIAEIYGLTQAVPRVRTPTTYDSVFYVDLTLLVFAVIGSRIARDAQNNVLDLRATIGRVSEANLALSETAEALRESEQQLVSIYNTVRDVIFYLAVEPEGQFRFVSVNTAFLRVTGLNEEAVIGRTVNEVIPEPSLTMVLGKYRQAITEHTAVVWEETSDYPTGQLTGEVSVTPVFDNTGTCTHLVGSVHDLTERKRAEGALRESRATIERQLHEIEAIYRAAPVGLAVLDADLKWLRINARMADIDGFSAEEHLGRSILEALPDIASQLEPLLRRVLHSGEPIWDQEIIGAAPAQAGADRTWLASYYPLKAPDGRTLGINSVVQEITERKRAVAVLTESEERFRNMADSAPVIIFQNDAAGNATFFNRQGTTFTGRTFEQLVGYGWAETIHPDDRERIMAAHRASLTEPVTGQEEVRLRRSDGEYRWMLVTSSPRFAGAQFAGYIGLIVDITDLKRTQEEALASQKLESVGRLAGGIAHDFNNLLGAVLAQADLGLVNLAASVRPEEELNNIRNVAIRGAGIVRQLMIYAGQESASSEPVDLSLLIEDMRDLLKVMASKHVVLSTKLARDLPALQANPAQMRQVVMNLVTNASEAIGTHDGNIVIRTARSKAGPDPRGEAGEWLELEVSDTGCGISRNAQAHIFDPFFTTKFAGHGLGLAVVQRIVKGLGGVIKLESDPGRGSTFRILLPCASELLPPVRQPISRPAPAELGRAATVLIVEDEGALRQAVAKMLSKTGFAVLEAANGSTAIDVLRSRGGKIDLMLLDMTIPGAPAQEVVAEAARGRPDIRVITTSAYSEEMVADKIHASQILGFIRKPFSLGDVVQIIRNSLPS